MPTPSSSPPRETCSDQPTATEGTIVAGRYKLLQQIGEGGMGSVWMADQTEPVKRRVAVKLIRVERGSSKTILSRFEAERQAIALMDHPHIAKLLDAGTTDAGQPYFVMELVKGIPLTEYCDAHKLSIPERLDLFQQICSAVQHAHQKGIIHRDLKPTNILVESHDGKPVPKVIDFGLAKATSGLQLTEHTLFTALRERDGHADLHGPGAGDLQRRGRGHPGRHVRAGRDPLRAADRHDADHPRDGEEGRPRRDAEARPRAGSAEARAAG